MNPPNEPMNTQPLFVPFGREGDPIQGSFVVDRVSYVAPETSFAVVRLVPADQETVSGFVAVGEFGQPKLGESYAIEGVWRKDARYGLQVKVSSAMRQEPQTLEAIERYVAGASVKGLGPSIASPMTSRKSDTSSDM